MTEYQNKYDVFLSFSSKDEKIARGLWDEMSKSGLRVFWSDESLKNNIGESFFSIIQGALQESRHFVLVCTKESMQSNWVKEEYESFCSNCYIPSGRKRKLIIYEASTCVKNKLPMLLKNIQTTKSANEIIATLGGRNYMAIADENQELREKIKDISGKSTNDKNLETLLALAES